jgi:hypothetical protein
MNGPTLICIACQWRTDDKVHQKYCDKRTGDPDGKNRHFLVPLDSAEGREMGILRGCRAVLAVVMDLVAARERVKELEARLAAGPEKDWCQTEGRRGED